MSAEIQAISDALKTTIAAINGAGSYSQDLSSVQQAMAPEAPKKTPSVYLWPSSWRHAGDEDSDLWSIGIRATFILVAYLRPTAKGGEVRMEQAIAADSDLMTALAANPGLTSTVFRVESVEAHIFNGGQINARPHTAIAWEIVVSSQRPGAGA